jgi:maleate isomerase
MPSLTAIAEAERELGLTVLSAATATTRRILIALGLDPAVPEAGRALDPSAAPVQAL